MFRTPPSSAKRLRQATLRAPQRLPGTQASAAATWDAREQPPKRRHVPISPVDSPRPARPAGRDTSALASATAAGTPVTVVCHIRPLSAREAADAAPSVLATRPGSSPGLGARAEALVQSGTAAYAFNHGAQPLPLLVGVPSTYSTTTSCICTSASSLGCHTKRWLSRQQQIQLHPKGRLCASQCLAARAVKTPSGSTAQPWRRWSPASLKASAPLFLHTDKQVGNMYQSNHT